MPADPRAPHPGITGIGVVDRTGGRIIARGWTITTCAGHCHCHMHPMTGKLVVAHDLTAGTIGLARFQPTSCECCTPWTADELDAVLADLYDLTTLETT